MHFFKVNLESQYLEILNKLAIKMERKAVKCLLHNLILFNSFVFQQHILFLFSLSLNIE